MGIVVGSLTYQLRVIESQRKRKERLPYLRRLSSLLEAQKAWLPTIQKVLRMHQLI